MVCPYKATTGLITAIMSVLFVSSTFANPDAGNSSRKNFNDEAPEAKRQMSPIRRMLVVTLLVLFHLDLFTTGYLRSGVKQLVATKMA